MHSDLVVLGGGPGGYAAAFRAADLGRSVTLVDADERLGGTCLLRGCIPSKALLHVARVISESAEMASWGVRFERPAIDLETMREKKNSVIEELSRGLKQLAKRRGVQVIHARGVFVDSETLQLEAVAAGSIPAERLTFDRCILATGSRPAVPKGLQLSGGRVVDSSGALELRDIPSRLLVVGGGYIGLEMGVVYAELGSRVTVIEMTDGLLPGVDRDLVKILERRLAKRFERIGLSSRVALLAMKGDQVEATLEAEGGSTKDLFDRVLVSVGRQPVSRGFGLENTKVEINERGFVVVDERQQTADPRILAIGDVAGEPMLAHKATYEGKIAAEVVCGETSVFDARAMPAVVFTDPEIAWAGLTETEARREGRKFAVASYPWQASGRAVSVGRVDGLTKWLVDPETDRLLGAGIVGAGAGELIAECALALEMGCVARDVAETIHPHPTLSETISFSSQVHLGLATEIYKPRRQRADDGGGEHGVPGETAKAATAR